MMVEIDIYFFLKLCKSTERIEAVERFVKANQYVTVTDILAILGIDTSEKEDA